MDMYNLDRLLVSRMDMLRKTLLGGMASKLAYGPVAYLRGLISEGYLKGLYCDPDTEPSPIVGAANNDQTIPNLEYAGTQGEIALRLSVRFRQAMLHVVNRTNNNQTGLTTIQVKWMIDNFYIHELMHWGQGMPGGNHLWCPCPDAVTAICLNDHNQIRKGVEGQEVNKALSGKVKRKELAFEL